ncbi:MAG TPA: ATP-binding protein [bacterium]|nr:ATP-binding protein [bacterium]
MARQKALMSWSGGKDSAWALKLARESGELEIVGAIVTITEAKGDNRVLLHGVREELLEAQTAVVGLPMRKMMIPYGCPGEVTDAALYRQLMKARAEGVTRVIYGDLFCADVRGYREAQLGHMGMTGCWPLWKRDTAELAREIIAGGVRTYLSSVDLKKLPRSFAGRLLGHELLKDLPPGVDPCGELGEYHSFVFDGPMFSYGLNVYAGEVFEQDGFAFADFRLEAPKKAASA